MAERSSAPVLEVKGLNVFYGASHALQGVDLTLGHGVLSVVGRNGMGKTTLCQAIMGLVPVSSGSITFNGQNITNKPPADIARLGSAVVHFQGFFGKITADVVEVFFDEFDRFFADFLQCVFLR